MERKQWDELCERIAAVWPGKKLPTATIDAWFTEFGSWANYEGVGKAISALGKTNPRAPSLADLRAEYGARGGPSKERQPYEDEDPSDRERWNELGKDWPLINRCMHDEGVHDLFIELLIRDADPTDTRLALLDEIHARNVQPQAPVLVPAGEFTRIGQSLPGALP